MVTRIDVLAVQADELGVGGFDNPPKLGLDLLNRGLGAAVVVALEALEGARTGGGLVVRTGGDDAAGGFPLILCIVFRHVYGTMQAII